MTAIPLEQTKTGLFERVYSWVNPTRSDGLVCLLCFFGLVALIDPALEAFAQKGMQAYRDGEFFLVAVAAFVFGIAMAAAWTRLRWKTATVLAIGIAVAFGLLAFSMKNVTDINIRDNTMREIIEPLRSDWASKFLIKSAWVVAAGFVMFLFTLAIRKFVGMAIKPIGIGNWSRSKALVAVAGILFFLGTLQNIFFKHGLVFEIARLSALDSTERTSTIVLAVMTVVILLTTSSFLASEAKSKFKMILVLIVPVVIVTGVWASASFVRSSGFETVRPLYTTLIFWTIFTSTILLVVSSRQQKQTSSRPTLLSILPISLIIGSCYVIYTFSLPVLLTSRFMDWQEAYVLQTAERNSNGEIRANIVVRGGWSHITCRFSDSTPPNVFENASEAFSLFSMININGLRPDIDVKAIAGIPISLYLDNSIVTVEQLNCLMPACTDLFLGNVKLDGVQGDLEFNSTSKVWVNSNNLKACASVLKCIERLNTGGTVYISHSGHDIDRQDLETLIEVSKRVPVFIDHEIALNVMDIQCQAHPKAAFDLRDITISYADNIFLTQPEIGAETRSKFIRFVLQNDIKLGFSLVDDHELFWDLAFAKAETAQPNRYTDSRESRVIRILDSSNEKFSKHARQFYWSFGEGTSDNSENENAKGLFLPLAEDIFQANYKTILKDFQDIESLSFEPLWLTGENSYGRPLKSIGGLEFAFFRNLKRLDIGRHCTITNSNFLGAIPKIEHLQIHVDPAIATGLDFAICKNLKTLVYIGTPSESAMKSLLKLDKLESVTVVNLDDLMMKDVASFREQIEKLLPDVKTTVVEEIDFIPTPPQEFKEHVKRTAEKIRAKYLEAVELKDEPESP